MYFATDMDYDIFLIPQMILATNEFNIILPSKRLAAMQCNLLAMIQGAELDFHFNFPLDFEGNNMNNITPRSRLFRLFNYVLPLPFHTHHPSY